MQRITRRFVLASTASLLCTAMLGIKTGYAQQTPNPGVPAATRTVNLTLEQRHVIRELVRDLNVDRASDDDAKVVAGDEVPGKVTLHPIPPLIGQKVPQIKAHRFYATQSRVILVDPQDQKVVEVIE
ncbi:MAG TPA: DUF1236 domain-containing protein [Xanthobacteraceae bacterium]|nr:DUF1236 domain-containing protein [Xanthobacteraceae bacterium]